MIIDKMIFMREIWAKSMEPCVDMFTLNWVEYYGADEPALSRKDLAVLSHNPCTHGDRPFTTYTYYTIVVIPYL